MIKYLFEIMENKVQIEEIERRGLRSDVHTFTAKDSWREQCQHDALPDAMCGPGGHAEYMGLCPTARGN